MPVCVAYEVDGVRHDEVPMTQTEFPRAVPIYETFPGWDEDISKARALDDLPRNARDYVDALEAMIGAPISVDRRRPGPRGVRSSCATCWTERASFCTKPRPPNG